MAIFAAYMEFAAAVGETATASSAPEAMREDLTGSCPLLSACKRHKEKHATDERVNGQKHRPRQMNKTLKRRYADHQN